jgi:hypothetical protein
MQDMLRFPSVFGIAADPYDEHHGCGCCEIEWDVIRLWGVWPITGEQADRVEGHMGRLLEPLYDTWQYHLLLEQNDYRDYEDALDHATMPLDTLLRQYKLSAQGIQQNAAWVVEQLDDMAPRDEEYPFRRDEFELDLESDLDEIWSRLKARREGYLAALPRVVPDPGIYQRERYYVQWP